MAIRPTMLKKPPYDPITDFVPIAHYLKSPFVLVVNPKLPIQSVPDLIKYVKERPGKSLQLAPSIGGAPHLAGEYSSSTSASQMAHVPYKQQPAGDPGRRRRPCAALLRRSRHRRCR